MKKSPSALLKRLDAIKVLYGDGVATEKLELLRRLERRRLKRAKEVLRLHEQLCLLRAYPDDRPVLDLVERMLDGFASRGDLRRHRNDLADSGIAGTPIHYRFFFFSARWLARRWPGRIRIDWPEFDKKERLYELLHLLALYSETPALDEMDFSPRQWIEKLKGPDETDAEFLIRRCDALRAGPFVKETFYEDLDVPIRLAPGPDTPARTRAKYRGTPIVFQKRPLSRARPKLPDEILRPPRAIRSVPPREARKLIDMAREAMATRARDLDCFAHADENDVRLVDCGDGLQFACLGLVPARRLMLESVYGFLTLKNGVPIGYVLTGALFNSVEAAYNVFDTYRGAEAGPVYGRVLAMSRVLFGADTFMVPPYQLGYGNREGLESGAWWFYYKLGFRPQDPWVREVLRGELKKMKRNPKHRSGISTLEELASENMYYFIGRPRKDIMGQIALGNIGMRITRYLADHFGANRESGIRTCSREAARLLGAGPPERLSRGQRLAWERWSPLVLSLPGVARWSRENKRALAAVVRAKGGRRETDFVRLFDRHRPLRRAVLKLSQGE